MLLLLGCSHGPYEGWEGLERSYIYYLLLSKVILEFERYEYSSFDLIKYLIFVKLRRLYSDLVPPFLVLDYLVVLYIGEEIELDISSEFDIVGQRFSNILKRSLMVR